MLMAAIYDNVFFGKSYFSYMMSSLNYSLDWSFMTDLLLGEFIVRRGIINYYFLEKCAIV